MAGIYIHIPFCKKLCSYCDFYHVITRENNSGFTDALIKEAEIRRDYLAGEKVETVYFGGGTPSVFSIDDLGRIMSSIRKTYNPADSSEITIELNPDDVTPEYLSGLKNLNFNRVSLGIQSWRDEDLHLLNRRHDAKGAMKALENVFSAGFGNVSVDLIYGIPGMKVSDWESNLDRTFSYDIKHLSAYHLTIEPGTMFAKWKEKGKFSEIDEEESAAQFHMLIDKSSKAGFLHYEISNFGKPDFFSIHNTNYWKQVSYIGLGPSAHSFNGYSRQWNVRNLNRYISALNSSEQFFEKEDLDLKTRFNEYVMTSLRTMWGIDLDFVEKTFEKEGYDYIVNLAGKFISYGLLIQDKKNLVLTDQGKLISDNIISEFMMPGED
jgi:oxygen-independent coproporphyrinogen-3 oxidase